MSRWPLPCRALTRGFLVSGLLAVGASCPFGVAGGPSDLQYSRCCACLNNAQCLVEDNETCAELYEVVVIEGCAHSCDETCAGIDVEVE